VTQMPTSTASPNVAVWTRPSVHTARLRAASVSGAAACAGRTRGASRSQARPDSAISPEETMKAWRQPTRLVSSGIR
jgi:hypothetical protein